MKPDVIVLKDGKLHQRFVVDLYHPQKVGVVPSKPLPAIVVVIGGGGKAPDKTVDPPEKYARSYHDLACRFAQDGFYTLVPSRRGDSRRPEDPVPNEGEHTHANHVEELAHVVAYLRDQPEVDANRIGVYGKSAGTGISLEYAARHPNQIQSIALWGAPLTISQWFLGPKADDFFKHVFWSRNVLVNKERFCQHFSDPINYVSQVTQPLLIGCPAPDPYALSPVARDEWTSPEEQLQLLYYSIQSRCAQVAIIKGAEHSMYSAMPKFDEYAQLLVNWFQTTLKPSSSKV